MANQGRIPWVTLALIALNLAVAFALPFSPAIADLAVFDPAHVLPVSALLCLFSHQNLLHLLANMVFLAAVGPLVEFTRGGWRFAVIYVLGGLSGVAAHWFFARLAPPGSPLLGASGSVAACVGYCTIRFARTKVPVVPNFGVPVAAIGLAWLLLQGAGSIFQVGEQMRGGVAYWAHLGGFLAGLAAALLFGGLREARHEYGHEVLSKMNERGPAAVLAAAEAILRQQPRNRTAQWEKVEALFELHESEKFRAAAEKFLVQADDSELAKVIGLMAQHGSLDSIRSVTRLKYADRLAESDPATQRTILESVAADKLDPRRPDALASLAGLLRETDPQSAAALAQTLSETYPDHDATRAARQRGLIP
ncbi:MAG: rhomboid family intramembrane serine protease [Armatimonadetes bacterium]|nr:rhomboid family intramembrane serine protease [Armatimonadota bacterium]MBS1710794.1 rhomboid family intramembrane serine protease [Armatimonadota bacterium]MBX3108466.1 rhomboid family intramembrane serine protease [Fimbriimonadaceae bacterium]